MPSPSSDGSVPAVSLEQNRFLLSLPADAQKSLANELELIDLNREEVLNRAGEPVDFIYFPTSCLASTVVTLENGSMVEAVTIGKEGFVGISAVFGSDRADLTSFIQVPGQALRLSAAVFQQHLENRRVRDVLGDYVGQTVARIAQSAACIAFHPVQERLARWLLLVRDGLESDEFALTHDFIAIMLGVHRPTVSIAVRILESAGLIEHRRGRIRILDGEALAEAACECYRLSHRTWSSASSPK